MLLPETSAAFLPATSSPGAFLELSQAPQVGCWYVAALGGEDRVVRVAGCQGVSVWVSVYQTCRPARGIPTFRKRGDDVMEMHGCELKTGPFHLVAGRAPAHITQAFDFAPAASAGRRPLGELQVSNTVGCGQLLEDAILPLKSQLIMTEPRFRHPKSMKKMQEMGFDDTPALRDIIMRNEGRVPGVLRQLGVA